MIDYMLYIMNFMILTNETCYVEGVDKHGGLFRCSSDDD